MTPVDSLIKQHDPENGRIGDCFRACIASLMDLLAQEVPHFCDGLIGNGDDSKAVARLRRWLKGRGLSFVEVPWDFDNLERCLEYVGGYCEDMHWTLLGQSKRGFNHVVVCRGNRIVHDPTYGEPHGIVGPATDGLFWTGWLVRR